MCAKGGGGLLKERKALAAMLWEAGIKTELVHAAAPSQTFQYEWAAARNIHWLVTINAVTFSTTDTVQVERTLPMNAQFRGLRSTTHGCLVTKSDARVRDAEPMAASLCILLHPVCQQFEPVALGNAPY